MGVTYFALKYDKYINIIIVVGIIAFFSWNIYYISALAIFFDSNNDWLENAPVIWGAHLLISIESTVFFHYNKIETILYELMFRSIKQSTLGHWKYNLA